jgi:hypothetical protein
LESVKHLINAHNRQLQFSKSTNQETALDAELQTCGFSLTVTFLVGRSWAEDEAKQARAEGKLLEEVRKRWEEENGRIEVYKSGKEWGLRYVKMKLKDIMQQLDTALPGEAFKTHVNDKIVRSWQATSGLLPGLLQKMAYLLQELGRKAHYFQQDLISGASQTAQELQIALGRRSQDVKIAVDQGTEEAKAAVAGMSSAVVERSRRFAENCKEEAAKLVHRFKSE